MVGAQEDDRREKTLIRETQTEKLARGTGHGARGTGTGTGTGNRNSGAGNRKPEHGFHCGCNCDRMFRPCESVYLAFSAWAASFAPGKFVFAPDFSYLCPHETQPYTPHALRPCRRRAAGGVYRIPRIRRRRFPPPFPESYVYPYGEQPSHVRAVLTLTFSPGTDLSDVRVEIPALKYNKSLLVLLTQDDCKQAAFSTTWAAINGRPLSDTYYYNAAQLRGGDLPPDTYGFGKTLASTDGTGREVRFSFTTALSPEWDYMDAAVTLQPGFTGNFYRFYMPEGLRWRDVAEMLNYGVGIAFHDVNTPWVDHPDSILEHFAAAQRITLDRLRGRGCKMLIEPNGNKVYTAAARAYDPIQTIFLQSGGEELRPFAVENDLVKCPVERRLWTPEEIPGVIEEQLAQPVERRKAVNIGVHGTDRPWSELLLWLHNTYGREGSDCVWMPAAEEYFEYNYLRCHAAVEPSAQDNVLTLKVDMPGRMYFYYPSLTLNLVGVDPSACTDVAGDETVTGLTWAPGTEVVNGRKVLAVHIDCRHALPELAEHYVELFENAPTAANLADARYFTGMLKASDRKAALLERLE